MKAPRVEVKEVSEREQLELEKLRAEIVYLEISTERQAQEAGYWQAMTEQVGKNPYESMFYNFKTPTVSADTGDAGAEV